MLSDFEQHYSATLDQLGLPENLSAIRTFVAQLTQRCRTTGMMAEDVVRWLLSRSPFDQRERTVRAVVRTHYADEETEEDEPTLNASQETHLKLQRHLAQRYEFRHNTVSNQPEFRLRSAYHTSFRPVGQRQLNTIIQGALNEGIPAFDRDVSRYLHSESVPLYHPLQEYLESLPVWDKKDHIAQLAATLPTSSPHWPMWFRRWFLSMVAHWQWGDKKYANALVPLLVGPQGCGKSTFCATLLPPTLREYYADDLDVKNKKQSELALTRFALINLDEFDAIGPSYQPFLKHILQKPKVAVRMPFEKNTVTLPRIASFIATSNNYDLLTDPTGSRRFLCVEIHGTVRNRRPVNYPQLYAQAVAALRNGEPYWFTPEEEAAIAQENQRFQQLTPEEQFLLDYFRSPKNDHEGQWLTPAQILFAIQARSGVKLTQKSIRHFGRILRRHPFPQRRIAAGVQFKVVEK